jgi:hypothetical protein
MAMGLLDALKLTRPVRGTGQKASATQAQQRLAAFIQDLKPLLAAKHPQGEQLRQVAVSAGTDAKAGLWEEVMKKIEQARKKLDAAKQVANADYGSDTPTESQVEPGAAEESLKDFSEDVKTTTAKLKQAQQVLSSVKGESQTAKALGESADALGKVAEGLDKVGDGAEKVLKVAAAVRKLEECRQVLVRVRAVDFTQTDKRVENAKAMGDLAKLFGEFGAEATKEVPMLKGYFQLISRLGEIWVPFARMVDRRDREATEAASDRDQVQPAAEPKGIAADTSRSIPLDGIIGFLDEQCGILDKAGESTEAARATRIRDDGSFDENFRELLATIERSHGVRAEIMHAIAEKTPLELPGEKWLQDDLARHWKDCYEVALQLRDGFDRKWNWMGVTYQPVVRALEAIRPKKA